MPGRIAIALALLLLASCAGSETPQPAQSRKPSILLITLDTTRADSIGPEAQGVETPSFNGLAREGRLFRQAYATAPQTLPSHSSMMTGVYPGSHGVHENARHLGEGDPLVAEKLHSAGYRTAAFVSSFILARRFGLARGFDLYDDELPAGRNERPDAQTTEKALAWMQQQPKGQPLFIWVHYFGPHHPYEPPEPFRSRYAIPYRGEVAAMDQQLGRLLQAFRAHAGADAAIVVAGDHGESLGEHGEAQHGNLLYQGAMRVPLVVAGPAVTPGVVDTPVSGRRVFHTILDLAGLGAESSLRAASPKEVVLGEAMAPFLEFGWQPQVMAVEGKKKFIHAGRIEAYDVLADPGEARDLGAGADLSREVRQALRDYPIPSASEPPAGKALGGEDQKRLAALGYIAGDVKPVIRKDAPRPADMAHLFETLDRASALFVGEQYAKAVPLFEEILKKDPHNLMAALRLAAAHSALGNNEKALAAFRQSERIAPQSPDVRNYLSLHYVRVGDWERAAPLLEQVVAESPDRVPALEAVAELRARQNRPAEALALLERVATMKTLEPPQLGLMGRLAMESGNTPLAIESFEKARDAAPPSFRHDLELGVLYLAARRFEEARAALDRVPPSHPAYPMALFKRAQVSVLLSEPDRAARIERAREHADATTRPLIANERLFR